MELGCRMMRHAFHMICIGMAEEELAEFKIKNGSD
jgi:hypothetical protein